MYRSTAAREATTFLALVYSMALGIALALPHAGIAPLLSVLVPVVSVAIITFAGHRRGHRRALWRSFGLGSAGLRSWPAAIVMPIVFLTVAYGTAILLGLASVRGPDMSGSALASNGADLAISLVLGSVLILGEEIGWRGYLLPRLQQLGSRRRSAVTTGFLHGLFHLPLILLTTTYDSIGNRFIVAPIVVVTITSAGVFYAWLKDRSASIWPVAIAHNTANTVFDIGAAATITTSPAALAYTAGESGIATMLVVAGFAVCLLARSSVWDQPATVVDRDRRPQRVLSEVA